MVLTINTKAVGWSTPQLMVSHRNMADKSDIVQETVSEIAMECGHGGVRPFPAATVRAATGHPREGQPFPPEGRLRFQSYPAVYKHLKGLC